MTKIARLCLMGDVLRVELRAEDSPAAVAHAEIEVVKLLPGVNCMSYPDGATLARKRCTMIDRNTVDEMLDRNGWAVVDEAGSEVCAYLDACTSNLPQDECARAETAESLNARCCAYGMFIGVGDKDRRAAIREDFPALFVVMEYAAARGCTHVNFDRDADPIDALPVFDW